MRHWHIDLLTIHSGCINISPSTVENYQTGRYKLKLECTWSRRWQLAKIHTSSFAMLYMKSEKENEMTCKIWQKFSICYPDFTFRCSMHRKQETRSVQRPIFQNRIFLKSNYKHSKELNVRGVLNEQLNITNYALAQIQRFLNYFEI